jgi:hypothetical protein
MKKIVRCNAVLFLMAIFVGGFPQLRAQTWSTTGNAGTSSSTNFLGTTDAVDLKFRTSNVERLTISNAGFVGIGTSTVIGSANFVISSSINNWGGMYTNGTTSTTRPFYGYSINNTAVAWQYYDPSKNAMILSVGGGDRFTVTNAGLVGINNNTPIYTLDVSGTGHCSGNFSAANGSFSGDVSGTTGNFGSVTGATAGFNSIFLSPLTISGTGITVAFGSPVFTIHPEVVFEGDATFHSSWFHAKQIVGTTTNSAAGVTGDAVHNSPSLTSFGVYGSANGSPFAYGVACSGNGYYSGDWFQYSDARFKTNVKSVHNALDLINQLQPKTYEYKRDEYKNMNFPDGQHYGFIAQDVEKVIPELVKDITQPVDMSKPDSAQISFKMVNYIGLIPVLTEAIQEQQNIINHQDSIIQEQNDRLTRLETKMDQMSSGTDAIKTNSTGAAIPNKLYPNQPNPFTQETIINYNISNESANASIVIRDMSGNIQKTFVLTQKGEGYITVQSQDMAAGLYTYELVVDGKIVDTKKMVVAK